MMPISTRSCKRLLETGHRVATSGTSARTGASIRNICRSASCATRLVRQRTIREFSTTSPAQDGRRAPGSACTLRRADRASGNRSLLMDRLEQLAEHADRDGGRVGVLYLDLDHFKRSERYPRPCSRRCLLQGGCTTHEELPACNRIPWHDWGATTRKPDVVQRDLISPRWHGRSPSFAAV